MTAVSAQFGQPDSGRFGRVIHSRNSQESGNRIRAELFLPACRIWAIIGQDHFGYLGFNIDNNNDKRFLSSKSEYLNDFWRMWHIRLD